MLGGHGTGSVYLAEKVVTNVTTTERDFNTRRFNCTCVGVLNTATECQGLVGTWSCPGFRANEIVIDCDYRDQFETGVHSKNTTVKVCNVPQFNSIEVKQPIYHACPSNDTMGERYFIDDKLSEYVPGGGSLDGITSNKLGVICCDVDTVTGALSISRWDSNNMCYGDQHTYREAVDICAEDGQKQLCTKAQLDTAKACTTNTPPAPPLCPSLVGACGNMGTGYETHTNTNCEFPNGAADTDPSSGFLTVEACQALCSDDSTCEGIVHRSVGGTVNEGECWKRTGIVLAACVEGGGLFDTYIKAATPSVAQTSGIIRLSSENMDTSAKQNDCLELCRAYAGATACQTVESEGAVGCYVHTRAVDSANNARNTKCHLLSQCTSQDGSDHCNQDGNFAWIQEGFFHKGCVPLVGACHVGSGGSSEADHSNPLHLSPGAFTKCANEGETCSCHGLVRYGFGDKWTTEHSTASIECSSAVFGDPFAGRIKLCECQDLMKVNRHVADNMQLSSPAYQLPPPDTYIQLHGPTGIMKSPQGLPYTSVGPYLHYEYDTKPSEDQEARCLMACSAVGSWGDPFGRGLVFTASSPNVSEVWKTTACEVRWGTHDRGCYVHSALITTGMDTENTHCEPWCDSGAYVGHELGWLQKCRMQQCGACAECQTTMKQCWIQSEYCSLTSVCPQIDVERFEDSSAMSKGSCNTDLNAFPSPGGCVPECKTGYVETQPLQRQCVFDSVTGVTSLKTTGECMKQCIGTPQVFDPDFHMVPGNCPSALSPGASCAPACESGYAPSVSIGDGMCDNTDFTNQVEVRTTSSLAECVAACINRPCSTSSSGIDDCCRFVSYCASDNSAACRGMHENS